MPSLAPSSSLLRSSSGRRDTKPSSRLCVVSAHMDGKWSTGRFCALKRRCRQGPKKFSKPTCLKQPALKIRRGFLRVSTRQQREGRQFIGRTAYPLSDLEG